MSTTIEPHFAPTLAFPDRVKRRRFVLRGVPWKLYLQLRDLPENYHIRMTYLDGTLELMAPEFRHEIGAERLSRLIWAITEELDIPCLGARMTTLQLNEPGKRKGVGKEPDTSFYFANEALVRDKKSLDLELDPPPDLAIEVDNTRSSLGKLPAYARLGIPEVWRYDVNSGVLWFGKLNDQRVYKEIENSVSLPMLTPSLVLDQLHRCLGRSDTEWGKLIRVWARETLGRDRRA